jgi:phosphate transport system substrate-binding protein
MVQATDPGGCARTAHWLGELEITMKHSNAWVALTIAGVLAGCGGQREEQVLVKIDGSSTVYPVTEAVAEEFQADTAGSVQVTVGVSGTGGGFKKFCRGETDISNASRPILSQEIEACRAAGVEFIELPVAFDALTVVINPANTWAEEMTVAELKTLWGPEAQGTIMRWNQVNPAWPDEPISLFGAGADSGTFDYFTEAVVGKAKSSRGDFTASEDDNVLVTGVAQDTNALGFFGFAYFEENTARLKAVKIKLDADSAAVGPSAAGVLDGSYKPLSRPIFIYVNAKSAKEKPQLTQFVEYYLTNAVPLIEEVKYVPLPARAYTMALENFRAGKLGTVFAGHSEIGVRVEDLLSREAR